MKKYIAPSVEILALNTESGLMLTVSGEISSKPQLSNGREDNFDWDEE